MRRCPPTARHAWRLACTGEARYCWQHYIPHRKYDPVLLPLLPGAAPRGAAAAAGDGIGNGDGDSGVDVPSVELVKRVVRTSFTFRQV